MIKLYRKRGGNPELVFAKSDTYLFRERQGRGRRDGDGRWSPGTGRVVDRSDFGRRSCCSTSATITISSSSSGGSSLYRHGGQRGTTGCWRRQSVSIGVET